jgi:hypothetical protein
MTKWVWKLYKQKDSLWVILLTAKYMKDGDLFKSKGGQGSQFWKSIHKVKHLFKWGVVHKVGNEKLTSFWDDVWMSTVPLRIYFPRIHEVCDDKKISVAACAERGWQLRLRRMLDTEPYEEWNQPEAVGEHPNY